MSACISRHGEYSEHETDVDYKCRLCGVFDEDGALAELRQLRMGRLADLRPVSGGGEVEAATEGVIEQAAREIYAHEFDAAEPVEDDWRVFVPTARALAAAGLLAGGVPGRSEAGIRTEWGWRHDAIGLTVPAVDESEARHEVGRFPRGRTLVCRESTPWRVAGTTEAGDNRG